MSATMELLRMGLFDQQVCVPATMTDAEIEAELPRHVATGLSGPANDWRVVQYVEQRVMCANDPARVHVVLACGGFHEDQPHD